MDYTYIRENSMIKPTDKEDFINKFFEMCAAMNIDIIDENIEFVTMNKLFINIFQASLRYARDGGNKVE